MSTPPIPSLTLVSDTGVSSSDRITRNNRIRVNGLVSNARWQFSINGGRGWRKGTTNPFTVPPGRYALGQVQVRQIFKGKRSAALTTFPAFTIDTSVANPGFSLRVPPVDGLTPNGRIDVRNIENGATWQYSLNSGDSWINPNNSQQKSRFFVVSGSFTTGQIRVRQTDLAGNVSGSRINFPAFSVGQVGFQIEAINANMKEGNDNIATPFTFSVTRTSSTGTATVNWDVVGVGPNPANSQDFVGGVLPSGTVSFADGQVDVTITIEVLGDNVFGPNEGFRVRLLSSSNAVIGTADAVIENDDIIDIIPTPLSSGHSVVLPNGGLGSDTGRGWTCTGLGYDPHPDRQFFWVGNYGQAKRPGSCVGTTVGGSCTKAPTVAPDPSIIAMPLNASSILRQVRLKDIYPALESIQGVTVDTATDTLWFVDNVKDRIHNISIPSNSLTATASHIKTFDTTVATAAKDPKFPINPNGIVYDPGSDQLIVLHKTTLESVPSGRNNNSTNYTISRVDKITGRVISSYETGHALGADQLFYDNENRYVFLSWGSDPGHDTTVTPRAQAPSEVSIFDHTTGTYIGRMSGLSKVYAAEGISILPTPGLSGNSTLYFLSDNYWENFSQVPLGDRANRLVRYTFPSIGPSDG